MRQNADLAAIHSDNLHDSENRCSMSIQLVSCECFYQNYAVTNKKYIFSKSNIVAKVLRMPAKWAEGDYGTTVSNVSLDWMEESLTIIYVENLRVGTRYKVTFCQGKFKSQLFALEHELTDASSIMMK